MFTSLFTRWFPQKDEPRTRQKMGAVSGIMGILLNLLLFGGKFLAGHLTGSVAILADAWNNLSDAGTSAVTFVGFRLAGQKPDSSHPFGHGRIEYLSGLLVSLSILLVGIELLKTSVEKILAPVLPEFRLLSILILGLSICVKLWMFLFHQALGKYSGSAALLAVAKDSLVDILATGTVLLGTLAEHFFHLYLDGYFGILIALFILYTGFSSAKATLNPLLGQPPSPALVQQIEKTVLKQKNICGIHDLIVHDYGPGRRIISLHAEVPENGDLLVLHTAVDQAEQDLKTQLGCEAVIHMDPIVTDDTETIEMREKIAALVRLIDPSVSIHDFRIARGYARHKLLFEVAVPNNLVQSEEQMVDSIKAAIAALDASYETVIQIDQIPV
ncbi:MAG: cation transporter [Oscillospiraceae bacterium]|nr:cation transporter [Oscillospiraceae bacterium]